MRPKELSVFRLNSIELNRVTRFLEVTDRKVDACQLDVVGHR